MDRIFGDPNMAVDAGWMLGGVAPPVTVRVIRKSPDAITDFGAAKLSQATTIIDVRVSEIANPSAEDRIIIGDEAFIIQGKPQRDRERYAWTVNLRPV